MLPKVSVKKLDPRAILPVYGSANAAGADLHALLDAPVTVQPGCAYTFHTGLSMELPSGYVGLIYARSGLACKRALAPANKVGVIDSDYRGEFLIVLLNHGAEPQTVQPGERIAQLVITPYLTVDFVEQESLSETERGAGGFGSTGRT